MTEKIKKTEKDPRRAFIDLLDELRDGDAQLDASTALTKLIGEVRKTCRPGALQITIKFQPSGAASILTITDEVTIKHPKEDKEATLMFSTEDCRLQKDNPKQQQLPLRDAPPPPNVRPMPEAQAAVGQ